MSTQFSRHVAVPRVLGVQITKQTAVPQGRTDMVTNNAGGVVFQITALEHVKRFLILGTEGGTYYADEKKHTYQAFEGLKTAIAQDAVAVVDLIVDVSKNGRAASNDPALFALACVMAFGQPDEKFYARTKLNEVARIGTHLFHFAEFVDQLKGWGSGTRKAFQNWYTSKTPEELAFQYVKYTQRDGWSHRDLLRKAHPVGTETQNFMFQAITHPDFLEKAALLGDGNVVPQLMYAALTAKGVTDPKDIVGLIKNHKLPREAIPTEFLNDVKVWETLLPNLKPEALMRNLNKLTSMGMLQPMSNNAKYVASVLTNPEALKRARIHPLNVLKARIIYSSGRGLKGGLTWTPSNTVVEALEAAFNLSFNFVEPSGKNILMGLDVSGSMSSNLVGGMGSLLSCREAAACMALVTAKVENNTHFMAFSGGFIPLNINRNDTLESVQRKMIGLPFDRTDCSLPMQYAAKNNIPVDCFQVYTDNETYAGTIHPFQALKLYRAKMGLPKAKSAVVAFTASKFTIADPSDPYMVDFVGFDANAPQAMAELAKM